MAPELLRLAFRFAMLIFVLAVVMLPFQRRGSAEFVVTVLSAVVGALFLGAVVLAVRLSDTGLPPASDKRGAKRLNGAAPTNGEGRD